MAWPIRMACQILCARVTLMQMTDISAIKNGESINGSKWKCNYRFKKIGLLTKWKGLGIKMPRRS
jgi:hypothetical protein